MNRPKWTLRTKEKFLEVLRERANVTDACKAMGLARSGAYDRRQSDPKFAREWDTAAAEAADKLEAEAWRRATEGWDEPVFYQGVEVGTIRKYSDRMLELLLTGAKPEKYGKQRHEITTKSTGQLHIYNVAQMTDAELDAIIGTDVYIPDNGRRLEDDPP